MFRDWVLGIGLNCVLGVLSKEGERLACCKGIWIEIKYRSTGERFRFRGRRILIVCLLLLLFVLWVVW